MSLQHTRYCCARCSYPFPTKTHLNCHFKDTHNLRATIANGGENHHECLECGKICGGKSRLFEHLDWHQPPKLKCHKCPLAYREFRRLQKHLKETHHIIGEKVYKCDRCELSFENGLALNCHSVLHESPKLYCEECGQKFFMAAPLRKHFMSAHIRHNNSRPGKFDCLECGKSFDTKGSIYAHAKVHKDRQIKCPLCTAEFRVSTSLTVHLAKLHQITVGKNHKCYLCGKLFGSRQLLECHQLNHGPPDINCPKCHLPFYSQKALGVHSRAAHRVGAMPTVISANKLSLNCAICCRPFGTRRQRLVSHLRVHYRTSLNCIKCNQMFYNSDSLKSHLRDKHSIEAKPSVKSCDVCGKVFTTLSSLRLHTRYHKPPQIACPLCPQIFCSKASLGSHLRFCGQISTKKVLDGKFGCAICLRKWVRKSEVILHLAAHKPAAIPCTKCNLLLKTAAAQRSHFKRIHSN